MPAELLVLAFATGVLALALTAVMARQARARGLLDVPNERSSHTRPTPRGGGAAIVVTLSLGFALLAALQRIDVPLLAALAGGLPVAAIGFLDDRRPVPARLRLLTHFAAAIWGLAWLGGLPPLRFGEHVAVGGPGGFVIAMLGVVWVTNLFNFMDGIDGIAASEATFMSWAAASLTGLSVAGGVQWAEVLCGASCLGFLRWNWPAAKIFMGDVGSGFLGYTLAILAVAASRADPVGLWVWLILGGAFFVDATTTLVRRSLRREHVHLAHRSHAYQWLARRWRSHAKVTLTFLAVNLLWLLPCALFAARRPQFAAAGVLLALAPLTVLAVIAGAGRRETNDSGGV
jgi:Fuc2NAc and GlcNAc transferase